MPADDRPLDAEEIHQAEDIAGVEFDRGLFVGRDAAPETAQVERDDLIKPAQSLALPIEQVAGQRVAVDQHQRLAPPGDGIKNSRAVDVREPLHGGGALGADADGATQDQQ